MPKPFTLEPLLRPAVWGGDVLPRRFGQPTTSPIGEAWLIHESLIVRDGAWAGQTLAEVTRAAPEALLGESLRTALVNGEPRFPLLAKLLAPRDWLSVQVHPDNAYARVREGVPYGKCEAWLTLEAEPQAQVAHGLAQPLTPSTLIAAAQDGTLQRMLSYVSLRAGDALINMPGVVHALGPGVLLYEIQQSCDITYRLYDWGRPATAGRALHLEQGAAVTDYVPLDQHLIAPLSLSQRSGVQHHLWAACEHFAAERLRTPVPYPKHTAGRSAHLITVVAGHGELHCDGTALALAPRASVVVPAACASYQIVPTQAMDVLISYVPDLWRDVIEPLRALGYEDARIGQLGGDLRRSDVWRAIHSAQHG